MEPIRRTPQDVRPGRPISARPAVPSGNRPLFSDFAVRPHVRPATNTSVPQPGPRSASIPTAPQLPLRPAKHMPVAPQSAPQNPTQPIPHASPIPAQPMQQARPAPATRPMPPQMPSAANQPNIAAIQNPVAPVQSQPSRPFAATAKPQQPHTSRTNRAGLVGFVCFVVLAGLLLSPFLPAKTFDSFPGSSQSSSSGDDSLACIHQLGEVSTTLTYDHKLGSPITYSYATTTTQKATCDNKLQTAVAGRTGQFNPLGLAIDTLLALVVAVVVSKIWHKLLDEQN